MTSETAAASEPHTTDTTTPVPSVETSLQEADALRLAGHLEEAEIALNAILAGAPGSAGANALLGHIANQRGNTALASVHFLAAHRLAPDDIWYATDAAEALRNLGRLVEAAELFRGVLEQAPGTARAHAALGHIANQQGDTEQARQHFSAASAAEPDNLWYILDAAEALRAQQHLDDAAKLLDYILEKDPGMVQAHAALGHIANRHGNVAQALHHFTSATTLAPENIWYAIDQADALKADGRIDEAEAVYSSVVARAPDCARAHGALGQIAQLRGDNVQAYKHLLIGLSLEPHNLWLRLDFATELRNAGDAQYAVVVARAALREFPGNTTIYLNIAETQQMYGEHTAALATLHEALQANPENVQILATMALEACNNGDIEVGSRYFEEALRLDPACEQAVRYMAEVHLRAGNPEPALKLYRSAIALRPYEMTFQLGLLNAMISLNEPDECLAFSAELLKRYGPHPDILKARINMLFRVGRLPEAVSLAREARTACPQAFWLWFDAFMIEKFFLPEAVLEEMIGAAPAHTWQEKAAIERARGQLAEISFRMDDAAAAYTRAATIAPADATTQFDLTRACMLLPDFPAALKHLKLHHQLEHSNIKLRGQSANVSQSFYGQILDEFRINDFSGEISAMRYLPPQEREAKLRQFLESDPENTAAAVAFVMALRVQGTLARFDHGEGLPIPRKIVQFWDTDTPPEDVLRYQETWQQNNIAFDICKFSNASAESYIQAHFPMPVVMAFKRTREPAQKSDLFRLAFLLHEGGIYADSDDRCIQPLEDLLTDGASLVLYQEDLGTIGNNFMAVMPGHPFIRHAFVAAVNSINRGDSEIVWLSTGPGLLTRSFAYALMQPPAMLPGLTRVLDRTALFRYVAIHCMANYKIAKRHWMNNIFGTNRTDVSPLQDAPPKSAQALPEDDVQQ